MAGLPLKGIRVIDLSMVFSGPICGRVLADLGAEVIKIEGLTHHDSVRALALAENLPLEEGSPNRGGYFIELNMNKYGITLDLTNPKGQELFKRLLRISDVVLENYAPGVMDKFGLGYEQLKEIKPDVILASLSGYGQTGPWGTYGAYGYTLEYACGLASLTGYPDSPPRKNAISFTDPWAGIIGAGLIVSALLARQRTKEGRHIDMSQRDIGSAFIGEAILDAVMNGRAQSRLGNRHPAMAPHGQYRCQGESPWLVIAVASDEEWQALRRALGDPEWARDPRFDTLEGRLANQDFIDQKIEEWTIQRDHYSAMHELQAAGVAAGAVLNGKEILLDPHLRARGLPKVVECPWVGPRVHLRQTPGHYGAWPEAGQISRPAPTFGQDNKEILCGLLGVEEDELPVLTEEEIIGIKPITESVPIEVRMESVKRRMMMMQRVGKVEKIDPDYKQILGVDGPSR